MKPLCNFLQTAGRAGVLALLLHSLVAQNPIPQVVRPPSPQAVKPGGKDFTLKVYGANFVPGSVVNWNRQARATKYVSGHEVDATILASDIVANTAGYITVTNPPPGGGVSSSSWTLVEVHEPTATIHPGVPIQYLFSPGGQVNSLLLADFNNDGIMDLSDGNGSLNLAILLGNDSGKFTFKDYAAFRYYNVSFGSNDITYGDFNNDGNLDLAYDAYFGRGNPLGMAIALGNGDGSFKPGWQIEADNRGTVLAADWNRDGNLDLISSGRYTRLYVGNGDGTFKVPKNVIAGADNVVLGDFNNDGNIDLLRLNPNSNGQGQLWLSLGNGDGTFQKEKRIQTFKGGCGNGPNVLVNDFNNDGNLDIVFCKFGFLGIMLGNGDGRFQNPKWIPVGPPDIGISGFTFAAGDFNADGKTDLLVSYIVSSKYYSMILLGNGDGTFQASQLKLAPKDTNGELGIVVGDFNSDGLLDFIYQEGGSGFLEYLAGGPG